MTWQRVVPGLLRKLSGSVVKSQNGRVHGMRGQNGGVFLREAMGEVEGLALHDERCNCGPCLGLGSIREKVHDYGSPVNGLLDGEEGRTRYLHRTIRLEHWNLPLMMCRARLGLKARAWAGLE